MHSKMRSAHQGAITVAAAVLTTGATVIQAAPAPAPDDAAPVEELVVTGTRLQGLEAIESPAPVRVLDASALKRNGQPDLIQSIAQNVPSFVAQAFGGDTANLTLSAKLRGVSPNHALVLVNGKRRHTTANLAVLSGAYQGGASADLSFIPLEAIERVEVLTDGAAAQYGSDAIAGVINIILKKDSGGSFGFNGGAYFDGGGDTGDITGSYGFKPTESSYLSLAGESRTHSKTDRGGIDPRVVNPTLIAQYPDIVNLPDYPYLNKIQGDASYHLNIATLNGGVEFGEGYELYTVGSYGKKHGQAYENYRTPSRLPAVYPLGFNPQEELEEDDYGATLGIKGKIAGDWSFDLSSSYGRDKAQINTISSGNVSLYNDTGSTPTVFHAGDFIATQWTSTLDVSRNFEVGFATPLNFAFGLEHRRDTYEIEAGDPASRYKEGSQSYPGFALTDAGFHDRDNKAVYVDFASSPIEKLQVDLAGRYEDFSDFGNTTVGKLSARYDFTPAFAVRGTVSTGFRAPTLAEEYYSATNVSPTSAFVQLPPNSSAASIVGINGLKPEKSRNFSAGIVMRPGSGALVATLDAYQITIDDRIVGSGSLYGSGGAVNSPAVTEAIAANGNVLDPTVTFTGINIFSNGLNTRTRGVDLVMTYPSELGFGHIDWTFAGNYNETEVTDIAETPAPLQPQSFFDAQAISDLEDASPKYRLTLNALWTLDRFSVNLRETLYGPTSELESQDGGVYYESRIKATPVTDLEFAFQTDSMKLSVGANNLFNEYPDKKNQALLDAYAATNDNSAVNIYPNWSPFGKNGGYYYAKATFRF